MGKALRKDFRMEIRKNKARFLSILIIVALGVAFFSGIQATSPDMRYSGDAYFDYARLMDMKVAGTMGLTDDDVEALASIDGVEEAIGGYSTDVYCGSGNNQKVIHVETLDDRINVAAASEGRLPEESGECLLDSVFASKWGYQVGDEITLTEDGDSELLLKKQYTVVGLGSTPLYIAFNRGNTILGAGEVNGFAYILPEDFDQEVYTQIYLRLRGAEDLISYTDAYDNLVEKITARVEGIQEEQCLFRYDTVVADARKELEDARKELEDGRKEAEEELADAEQELKDGEKELEDGKKEYEDGKKELADARKELEEGKKELADARQEIEDGKQEFQDGKQELADGRKELESAKQELSDSRKQLESVKQELSDGWAQLSDAKSQLSDGKAQLASKKTQLAAAWQQYHDGEKELSAGEAQLAAAKKELEAGKKAISDAKTELEAKQKELDSANAQLSAGKKEIETFESQLNDQKQQCQAGLEQVTAAEGQLSELQAAVDTAEAAVSQAQSAVDAAQAEYERIRLEVESGNLSQEELDVACGNLEAAKSSLEQAGNQAAVLMQQLESTREQISSQRAELEAGLAAVESGFEELRQKKAELSKSEEQITSGQQAVDQGWKDLKAQESSLTSSEKTIAAKEKELEAGRKELKANYQTLASAQDSINDAEDELSSAEAEISANEQKLIKGENELKVNEQKITDGEKELKASEQKLIDGENEIKANEQKLADGEKEIEENEQKLVDGEKEIRENEKKLQDAKKDIEEGEKELEDGWKEYEDAKKEAEEEIADGEKELEDAEKEIDDLKVPQWYVTDRHDLPEYSDYGDNADRIRSLGKVFPVIFFLVAALISLTTMTRMVEEQRTQIGTLKALGYGKIAIASKYLSYAFLATAGGSVLGTLIGEKIIPIIIIKAYGIMYHNMASRMIVDYELKYALIASVAAVVCTVGATISSCYRVLMETPASLMRPPAPKEGKRVLIERITVLWKHLNFTWKSCLRNLFRYKKRLFMTIFGIAGSMGLMLVGFGVRDSISNIPVLQYQELQHYDGTIIDDEDATDKEREALYSYLDHNETMERYTRVSFSTMTIPLKSSKLSTYVYVPEDMDSFHEDVTLRNRRTKELYELTDEGAVICEKTSALLDVSVGDNLTLEKDNQEYHVKIAAIVENYLGHYVYMTPKVYEETFGEKPEFLDIIFTLKDEYINEAEEIGQEILKYPAALSISYTTTIAEQVERMLGTLGSVIIVLIVSAGLLAFVVLYNLNNINITERKRELATLKVLGFFDGEVSQYVLRENILLTIMGIIFGSGFGIFLHRFIILTVEVDSTMFGREIRPVSFIYCAVLTSLFSVIVNAVMHFKMKKIDMVESLKSVE